MSSRPADSGREEERRRLGTLLLPQRERHGASRAGLSRLNSKIMDTREPQAGDIATLHKPYLGSRRIELIEQSGYMWIARICESGKEIEVWEDEFELDD